MALEGKIKMSEKDIEDYLWSNPKCLPFIDGWIDRQLQLNNGSILDMLGYCTRYGAKKLVVVELKSRPLLEKDVLQVGKYQNQLIETIEDIGLISLHVWSFLVGTKTKYNKGLSDASSMLNVGLFYIDIVNGNIEINQLDYEEDYIGYKKSAIRTAKSGRYDNLIKFLLPEMPDFMQEEYRLP